MTTTITRRIATAPADASDRRVALGTHGTSWDAWARSWGNSWGNAWRVTLDNSDAGLTSRINATPTTSITKRVSL